MIKIEFPAHRTDIALAVSKMLNEIGRHGENEGPADALTALAAKGEGRTGAETIALKALNAGKREQEEDARDPLATGGTEQLDEYRQVAVDALLLEDEMAEVSNEDATMYGENLRVAYGARGGDLVPLSVAAEVLSDGGDVEKALLSSISLCGILLQKYEKEQVGGDDTQVDEHGVRKDGSYCATAAKPFYGSGKTKGQWKKKQGVGVEAYTTWYAAELLKVKKPDEGTDEQIDTSAAFGTGDDKKSADAPTDPGALMMWVSEQQTAGNVTEAQVTAAYAAVGLSNVTLLFSATAEKQAEYARQIFAMLNA